MPLFLLEDRDFLGFQMIIKVWLNQIFSNFNKMMWTKFDYGIFHIYRCWAMALFLLDNRECLGFRMIFKVPLNHIFWNFNTMLYTLKYMLSSNMVHFTYTIPELWPFFS